MCNLLNMRFNFLDNVLIENNEIHSGQNSLVVNEVGKLICEKINDQLSTEEILSLLEKRYPLTDKHVIEESFKDFILSLWKQAIYLNRENDIEICKYFLREKEFLVFPSFVEIPSYRQLSLNYSNGILVDNFFKSHKLLQSELGYKIIYIAKLNDKGHISGLLVIEVTRFDDSYIVNSLFGEFTVEFCKNHLNDIKNCLSKYFIFFGNHERNISKIELIYLQNGDKTIDSSLCPIGTLSYEIGSNSLFVYSQK